MDMRFGDPDPPGDDPATDFRSFVAAVSAHQASTPAAQAAASARKPWPNEVEPAAPAPPPLAIAGRRGAFHQTTASALLVERPATGLKGSFTVAFQASFKPKP